MERPRINVLAVVGLWGLFTSGPAGAQAPAPPYARPAVSPYINLSRTNGDPGINYYGIVRPELELGRSVRQLQQGQLQVNQELAAQQQATTLPPTGHPVGFMTQATYFMTLQGRGAATRPATPATPAPPQPPVGSRRR